MVQALPDVGQQATIRPSYLVNVRLPDGRVLDVERYEAACNEVGLGNVATEVTPEELRLRARAMDLAVVDTEDCDFDLFPGENGYLRQLFPEAPLGQSGFRRREG